MGRRTDKRGAEIRAAAEAEIRMAGKVSVEVWGLVVEITSDSAVAVPPPFLRGMVSVLWNGKAVYEKGTGPRSGGEEDPLRIVWLRRFKTRLGFPNGHAATGPAEVLVSALLYARSQQQLFGGGDFPPQQKALDALRRSADYARLMRARRRQ